MTCPFCQEEMATGVLTGDGRSKVFWEPEEKKLGVMDRMFGNGALSSATYAFSTFKIKANYCPRCKKMIIDTDIVKGK